MFSEVPNPELAKGRNPYRNQDLAVSHLCLNLFLSPSRRDLVPLHLSKLRRSCCFARIAMGPEKIYWKPHKKQAQTNDTVSRSGPYLVNGDGSRCDKGNGRQQRIGESKKPGLVLAAP